MLSLSGQTSHNKQTAPSPQSNDSPPTLSQQQGLCAATCLRIFGGRRGQKQPPSDVTVVSSGLRAFTAGPLKTPYNAVNTLNQQLPVKHQDAADSHNPPQHPHRQPSAHVCNGTPKAAAQQAHPAASTSAVRKIGGWRRSPKIHPQVFTPRVGLLAPTYVQCCLNQGCHKTSARDYCRTLAEAAAAPLQQARRLTCRQT
jgi:hypothetical protein